MLNIYIGKENLPADKKFINDVEAVFLNVDMYGSIFQKNVIEVIDKGRYLDKSKYIDRFGNHLYLSDLSTGSKALLLTEAFPDMIINFDEVGLNAISLLSGIGEGNIFFSSRSDSILYNKDVTLNGLGITVYELNSLIKGGEFCGNSSRRFQDKH